MASVRDVRKAIGRGDADAALLLSWNALEPLRLKGDVGGLQTIGRVAVHILERGDGSQRLEAGKLLEVVEEALGAGRSDEPVASFGPAEPGAGPARDTVGEVERAEPMEIDVPELDGPPDEEEAGPRIPPLVWALIIAAFVLFNVLSGLLRE